MSRVSYVSILQETISGLHLLRLDLLTPMLLSLGHKVQQSTRSASLLTHAHTGIM